MHIFFIPQKIDVPPPYPKHHSPIQRSYTTSDMASAYEIAQQRISACRDGCLDLGGLGLETLPPLPDDLIELNVCRNSLTALAATLPPTLSVLNCSQNLLTELPPLPASLAVLSCHSTRMTELPPLPASLERLTCGGGGYLKTLPSLPPGLVVLECCKTQMTELPPLPVSLRSLSCNHNPLKCLPPLPDSLRFLTYSYEQNVVPSARIVGITCFRNNREIRREHGETVQMYVQRAKKARAEDERAEAVRRCKLVKEELVATAWNPERPGVEWLILDAISDL
jgi:hypothetical protein